MSVAAIFRPTSPTSHAGDDHASLRVRDQGDRAREGCHRDAPRPTARASRSRRRTRRPRSTISLAHASARETEAIVGHVALGDRSHSSRALSSVSANPAPRPVPPVRVSWTRMPSSFRAPRCRRRPAIQRDAGPRGRESRRPGRRLRTARCRGGRASPGRPGACARWDPAPRRRCPAQRTERSLSDTRPVTMATRRAGLLHQGDAEPVLDVVALKLQRLSVHGAEVDAAVGEHAVDVDGAQAGSSGESGIDQRREKGNETSTRSLQRDRQARQAESCSGRRLARERDRDASPCKRLSMPMVHGRHRERRLILTCAASIATVPRAAARCASHRRPRVRRMPHACGLSARKSTTRSP